jgi:hypothetical protein
MIFVRRALGKGYISTALNRKPHKTETSLSVFCTITPAFNQSGYILLLELLHWPSSHRMILQPCTHCDAHSNGSCGGSHCVHQYCYCWYLFNFHISPHSSDNPPSPCHSSGSPSFFLASPLIITCLSWPKVTCCVLLNIPLSQCILLVGLMYCIKPGL